MNINSIISENNNSKSPLSANASKPSSDSNMFMTLLVAQLKNQDPLAPQEGTEFVAQLAQFNSLDQLIGIRQSIEELTVRLQQQGQNQQA